MKVDIDGVRNAMFQEGNMIYFLHNGKECGADIEGGFPAFKFLVWCGEKNKYYNSFEKMANDDFFDGCSLVSLLDTVEVYFS